MPNSNFPFTIAKLEAIKPKASQQWFTDAKQAGLQFCVTPNGVKSFYFRRKIRGKSTRKVLGLFPRLSLDDARRKARELHNNVQDGLPLAGNRGTFADAFNAWLDAVAKKSKKTWQEDKRKFDRDLKPLHDRRLRDLTTEELRKFHSEIGKTHPVQANRLLALIKTVITFAVNDDDFPYQGLNPASKVKKFPEQSRERFLSTEEMKRFFAAMSELDELYSDFFTVLLYTGVRRGNLAEMNWRHVDLDHAVWSIPRTKNGDGLTVPLAAPVVDILKRRKTTARNEWVFPSRHKPWTNMSDPRKAWDKLVAAAELHDVHMHDLRRTLGSWQAMNGVSELVVGRTLGHRPGSKATSVYARMNLDTVRTAVDVAVEKMAACAKEGANDE